MTRLSEIGQQLKEAREARRRSLEDIALETRLKFAHLQAIEAGNEQVLPEPIYVKSFIRKYAQAVGLPAEELANSYWQTRPLPAAPAQTREFSAPWWIFPWLIGALMLGGLAAYKRYESTQAAKPIASPAPTPTPVAATPMPAATSSLPQAAIASPSPTPTVKPSPAATPKPTPRPTPSPKQAIATPSVSQATASTVTMPSPTQAVVLKLHATGVSWVQIVQDGHEIYEDTMMPGQTHLWPVFDGLSVTIGNGAGVEVTLGDRALGALGAKGQVVRRVFTQEER